MRFTVGIIGSGAMGSGIAQVAVLAGHHVIICDNNQSALGKAEANMRAALQKLQDKKEIPDADGVMAMISFTEDIAPLAECGLVIEAIVENLAIKKSVFTAVEQLVSAECILATNTSSLSVTAIAAACKHPERVIGLHFFNPAPRMALVEVVPALQTRTDLAAYCSELMHSWHKIPVVAKDTPGFIVNRVARPFYGEALRILEEGIANKSTIDWAMTEIGGFRMGPFELMDFIGHDVNYVVTETVFQSFFYDPRYKPSFSQKRLLEAGWLGRKTGKGFYNYADGKPQHDKINADKVLGIQIFERILAMLINESVDALYLGIASADDLEVSMTKGVNYPKGLLHWCDEWSVAECLAKLDGLYDIYHEDRYRASRLLRTAAFDKKKFFV